MFIEWVSKGEFVSVNQLHMSLGTALEFGQLRFLGTGFGCFKLVALFLLKFNIFALGRGTYFRCFHSIAATFFSFYQFLPPVRP